MRTYYVQLSSLDHAIGVDADKNPEEETEFGQWLDIFFCRPSSDGEPISRAFRHGAGIELFQANPQASAFDYRRQTA